MREPTSAALARRIRFGSALVGTGLAGVLLGACGTTAAASTSPGGTTLGAAQTGDLTLSQGWATEVDVDHAASGSHSGSGAMAGMDMSSSSAAYFTLADSGGSADALVSASSPQAGQVQLHETRSDRRTNSGTMVRVGRLDVPAGGKAVLRPGGYHLMLTRPVHSLTSGERVSLTLRFRSGEVMHVRIPVLDREDRPES